MTTTRHPSLRAARVLLLATTLAGSAGALAEVQYVTDNLTAQLRSAPASDGKAVGNPLQTGNPVEVLQRSPDGKWARVRFQQTEGWLPSTFLQKEQAARDRLLELQGRHDALARELKTGEARLKELEAELQTLRTGQQQLQDERNMALTQLGDLKMTAAAPQKLAESNRALGEKSTQLAIDNERLQAEVARLRQDESADFFLYGALVTFFSVAVGWIIARQSGRRSSGW